LVSEKTMASSDFFSLPRSWAFFGSFQTAGSSSSPFTCSSFSDFVSKSKIPPKFGFARGQIGEQGGEGVDAFGFHGFLLLFRLKSNLGLYPTPPRSPSATRHTAQRRGNTAILATNRRRNRLKYRSL
jgi:hypothetical protein